MPRPPQRPLPHWTARQRSPPRTAADARGASPEAGQVNASAGAAPDQQLVDVSVLPSQLLTVEVLRRPLDSALRAVVAVDHDTFGLAVLDRHAEGVDDEVRRLGRVDRPADDPAGEGVEHDRAVHLALAGAVLGDVGQPQPVRLGPSEVTVHEIRRGRGVRDLARYFGRPGSPARPRRRITSSTVQRATVIWRPRTSSA